MSGITIIVPLFNKESTICATIEMILAQDCKDYEIIVVDDGSTDSSIEQLSSFCDQLKLVRQPNQGPSAARNRGATYANYDVLCFIDADDYITEDFISSHLNARKSNPEIELSINSFDVVRGNDLVRRELMFSRLEKSSNINPYYFYNFDYNFVKGVHSSGFCINQKLFSECLGFDEKLRCWEITDALTRFSLSAKGVALINNILSYKREDDPENSQFAREKDNIEQYILYCQNIFGYLPTVPNSAKLAYFKTIENLCVKLWHKKRLSDLVSIYKQAKELSADTNLFRLGPKIRLTAELCNILGLARQRAQARRN